MAERMNNRKAEPKVMRHPLNAYLGGIISS